MSKAQLETMEPKRLRHRSSMSDLSPVENIYEAIEDDVPEPLTARKVSASRSWSASTAASYPWIPRRRSSLSASVRTSSAELATSTRTPSLSDSLYQIEIAKIRKSQGNRGQNMHNGNGGPVDDPFVDRPLAEVQTNSAGYNYGLNPRLVVRWSSGSWTSPELAPSSNTTSLSFHSAGPASDRNSAKTCKAQGSFGSLCPVELPITFVNVRLATKKLEIGFEPASFWATVHVSADVSVMPIPGASNLAPLDIVILLDSVPQSSVNHLTQVTLSASVLASHLIHRHDRIALAYVDESANSGFQLLLSLGFHTVDAIRTALNTFSQHKSMKDPKSTSNLREVIQRVSGLFCYSPRSAFCHLFFVSATPPAHLSVPRIDQAIGFHTISPQPCFPFENGAHIPGWHISYNVGNCGLGHKETPFMRKVSRVIRQLRTGIQPGSIRDLKIYVAPEVSCEIRSVAENRQLSSLRPGETWSVPVLIHVPAVSQPVSPKKHHTPLFYHPIVEDLLTQINNLLQELISDEVIQPVLAARVEYQHSLLPDPSTVHVQSHLGIVRRAHISSKAIQEAGRVARELIVGLSSLAEST